MRSITVREVVARMSRCRAGIEAVNDKAGYRAIAPLFLRLDFHPVQGESRPALAARATTLVIIGSHGNGLQLRPLDQTQCNAHIVKPFLQFAVHITPPSGKCRQPTSGPLKADHSAKSHFTPATECRGRKFFLLYEQTFQTAVNRGFTRPTAVHL
jgi:hypothetical protein